MVNTHTHTQTCTHASILFIHSDTIDSTQGILLDKNVEQFELLWKAWELLLEKGLKWFNFSVVIETEIDKEILVSGSGSLQWPRIVYPSILEFPLTLIGNTSVRICVCILSIYYPFIVFIHSLYTSSHLSIYLFIYSLISVGVVNSSLQSINISITN